jgi:hypothetical protein
MRHKTVVDVSALKSHALDMMDYCIEHRDMTLMDVIQNALGAEK